MGPLGVVGFQPRVGDLTHPVERVEEMRVEHLLATAAVEPFDEGVVVGLSPRWTSEGFDGTAYRPRSRSSVQDPRPRCLCMNLMI